MTMITKSAKATSFFATFLGACVSSSRLKMMKRKREEKECMDIVWQTPANPPLPQDYIVRNGNFNSLTSSTHSSINFEIEFFIIKFFLYCAGIRFVRPYYFEFIAHVSSLCSFFHFLF